MPSPIEVLMAPESLVIFSLYAFLIVWEYMSPARTLPVVRYWKLSGALFFSVIFMLQRIYRCYGMRTLSIIS
jgi:hypothetical protein